MASSTAKTVAGVLSVAVSNKGIGVACFTFSGAETANGNVAWGGTSVSRKQVNWLPSSRQPVLNADGTMNQVWYRFFHEISEHRLGGIDALTVPQVVVQQVQTQDQVVFAQQVAVQASANIAQVASVVNTQTAVAKQNNLAGANQIATLPSYKQQELNRVNDL